MGLPKHLKKLFDTPEKIKRADNILDNARAEQFEKMKSKGYSLKGNKFVYTGRK